MVMSAEELEWQSELGHANRAFTAMVAGQRYENITREEAKRIRQAQPAQEDKPRQSGVRNSGIS